MMPRMVRILGVKTPAKVPMRPPVVVAERDSVVCIVRLLSDAALVCRQHSGTEPG